KNFGRIAAQAAKQVVTQRVREAERGVIFSEYADREEDVMTGIIQRVDPNFVFVDLGKIEAKMAKAEQIDTENYQVHDRIKVCLKWKFQKFMMALLKLNQFQEKQEIVLRFPYMQIIRILIQLALVLEREGNGCKR